MVKPAPALLCLSVLSLSLLSSPLSAQSTAAGLSPAPAASAAEDLEAAPQTILVSGSRPGPGLWKVEKDGHVLWVFGSYGPLPKNMEWRSRQVEKVIAASQEFLRPPGSGVGVGWISGMRALPFLIGIKNNPDGAQLKDILPPEVYARWEPMRQTYFANNQGIERERPGFVASELRSRALFQAGLDKGSELDKAIYKIVKQYNLKVTDASVRIELNDPGKAAREFKKSSMDDVPCLVKTIELLESEVGLMRARANAWAVGEIEGIRKLDYSEREACDQALQSSSMAKNQPELKNLKALSEDAWLRAAEQALANNASTFTVVSIRGILAPQGVIARLQAKGYTVTPPQ